MMHPPKRTREPARLAALLVAVAALDSRFATITRRPEDADRRQSRAARAAAYLMRRCESQRSSDGGRRNSAVARDCKSMHWRPLRTSALALRPARWNVWWSRATVRKLRSTGRGYHYRWVQSFAGARQGRKPHYAAARQQWCGTPEVRTVFLDHLSSPFGVALMVNIFTSKTTDRSCAIRIRTGRPASPQRNKAHDSSRRPIVITGPRRCWQSGWLQALVGVGSNSNVARTDRRRYERARDLGGRRGVGAHRIFASGVRNPPPGWEPRGANSGPSQRTR